LNAAGAPFASPWRRLAAWGLDYLVIAAYLVVLTAASLGLEATPVRSGFNAATSGAVTAELLGFVFLTAPVTLYFAILEASSWQATLGKRALGVVVVSASRRRLSFGRAILREAVRFLPWELSHALLWRVALAPDKNSVSGLVTVGFAAVYLLVLAYLITLFVGTQHRTVYDRVAGSYVLRRT
jgi:uncharacterized RDD family membrane protein YckC